MPNNYDAIPEILKWDRQWCVAGPDDEGKFKAPHGLGPRGLIKVSPTNNIHWRDFETTVDAAATSPPCGIGYVLTKTDPYTCIDLDVKNSNNEKDPSKWTSQEDLDRFWSIVKAFDSYTEFSASGQGLHIWVKGKIGAGCKRDGVEVYSQERFIVCTGNVLIKNEIQDRQDLLELLVSEIRKPEGSRIQLVDIEQAESDEVILKRAADADNGDKFRALMEATACTTIGREKTHGTYFDLGYPTQSEADLALLSIFTFYSKSNQQCRRLFRQSKLAQRPKALKNDVYLNRTLTLIRGRQAAEENNDAAGVAATAALLARMGLRTATNTLHAAQIPVVGVTAPPVTQNATSAQATEEPEEILEEDVHEDFQKGTPLNWPPGMIGELAKYIFESSPRPVREVAIIGALGLLAGVCGKSFSIPQSGLNVYLVLVARSAIGKEAMHSGIADIMGHVRNSIPNAMSFVDFTDYASGPALSKAVALNPSFVNVSGEWGRKLRRLGQEDGRDGPMQQLRTVMTNLYQKSGPKSIVGGIGYSDKEKNIASVSGVAYSMIGETTPNTFYQALTETMMEDGFLSRFTLIEYTGERPAANLNVATNPDPALLDYLCGLISHSLNLIERFQTQEVQKNSEAAKILSEFDKECDIEINSTSDEGWRQMWNRAHLKAFRISALLAVADNYVNPIITKEHVDWAMELIRKDIGVMRKRISAGDVGVGDAPRERKLLSLIERYLKSRLADSYNIPERIRTAGIVPRKFLQISTQRSTAFTAHRGGQNVALDSSIKSLIDSGYLVEMAKEKMITNYDFHGKCYRVITLPVSNQNSKTLRKAKSLK